MPGLDYEVHPSTVSGEKYGCHNRPAWGEGYFAPDRVYIPDGRYFEKLTYITSTMSKECRFDLSLIDPKCRECKHQGTGEAYDQMIRSRGT